MKKGGRDAWIAISVILCSIVLFTALAFGLSGGFFAPGGREIAVRFPDITGVGVSSQVRYGGARAGVVSSVRMLTAAERATDPANLVEITLHLTQDVPAITKSAQVSIASDTLLSDKFVLLHDDPATGVAIGPDTVLQGIPPTTFDRLTRNLDSALEGFRKLLGGGAEDEAKNVLARIDGLVGQTEGLLAGLQPVVKEAGAAVGDARLTLTDARAAAADIRSLLADNKDRIGRAVVRIDSAAGSIDSLAKKGEAIVRENASPIARSLASIQISADNLQVTSTYSKFLLKNLAERPNRILWGSRPPNLPSEQEILESGRPIPLR